MGSNYSSEEIELKAEIERRLPGLEESTIREVLQLFRKLGVKSLNDLEYVRTKDLLPSITVVQARKLLKTQLATVAQEDKGLSDALTRLIEFFLKHGDTFIHFVGLISQIIERYLVIRSYNRISNSSQTDVERRSTNSIPNSGRSFNLAYN